MPWDSSWYAQIAASGYTFDGNLMRQQPVAFLPLYPMMIRAVHALGFSNPVAELVVCMSSAAGGMALLYRALSFRLDAIWSAVACALMMASPFSIYFLNGYSEALYLLFFGAFWWALLRRRSFSLAAGFAGLAGAVRPFGLILAVVWAFAVLLDAYRGHLTRRRALAILLAYSPLAIAGFIAVSLFYYVEFGDLFLYRNAMLAWSRDLVQGVSSNPIGQLPAHIYALFHADIRALLVFPPAFARVPLWSFVLLLPFAARRLPVEITLYGAGLLLFCVMVTATGLDLGRHLATNIALPLAVLALIWPIHDLSAQRTRLGVVRKAFVALLFFSGLIIQALLSMRYFHGDWVS